MVALIPGNSIFQTQCWHTYKLRHKIHKHSNCKHWESEKEITSLCLTRSCLIPAGTGKIGFFLMGYQKISQLYSKSGSVPMSVSQTEMISWLLVSDFFFVWFLMFIFLNCFTEKKRKKQEVKKFRNYQDTKDLRKHGVGK